MGRRKGSLNKSTIEKMKLALEQEKEKNIPSESSNALDEKESPITSPTVIPKIKKEKYNSCERCKKEVYCDPIKIDLNFILGLADYHRESKRYVRLCMNCAKELNKIIDDWLCNPAQGGNIELRRFPK